MQNVPTPIAPHESGGLAGTRTQDQPRRLRGCSIERVVSCIAAKVPAPTEDFSCASSDALILWPLPAWLAPNWPKAPKSLRDVWWCACARDDAAQDGIPDRWSNRCSAVRRRHVRCRPMAYLRSKGGGLAGTRTQDQRLKRPLLYRLSYQPTQKFQISPGLPTPDDQPRMLSGLLYRLRYQPTQKFQIID